MKINISFKKNYWLLLLIFQLQKFLGVDVNRGFWTMLYNINYIFLILLLI